MAALNLSGCATSSGCNVWNFEDSQSVGGGLAVHGDELRLYVSGRCQEMGLSQTGVFTLRRDGFASLRANGSCGESAERGVELLTRPLRWQTTTPCDDSRLSGC